MIGYIHIFLLIVIHQSEVLIFSDNCHKTCQPVTSTQNRVSVNEPQNYWDNNTLVDRNAFTHPRCTMESWHIHKEEDALNREKGLLPDVYLTLQSSHKFDTQPNACDTDQCV